jgi:hypothetical protein
LSTWNVKGDLIVEQRRKLEVRLRNFPKFWDLIWLIIE